MKRIGIIDIGTNSVKFFVGEKREDGAITTIVDENDVVRLGEGLQDTGRISDEALERGVRSVAAFAARARENGAERIAGIGTMALRTASNGADFVRRVKELCGVEVRIISGEEEARLSYLAVQSGMEISDGDWVIFDTGGGSTEFIFSQGAELVKRFSVNLGAIRITERFFMDDPVVKGSVEAALRAIDEEFAAAGVEGRPVKLVGIGGAVTSMGAVKQRMAVYDPDAIQGSILTRADIAAQIREYSTRTIAQRQEIPGLQPKRAKIILAGACILQDIIDRLGVDEMTVSVRGARHGLAYELSK